jgi:Holliday junction resolvase
MRSNDGVLFQRRLCKILQANGFWAHELIASASGQPFDIIAAKNGRVYAIECKVCSTSNTFPLKRIENNQIIAMRYFIDCGNKTSVWFAFERKDKSIWFTPADEILGQLKNGKNGSIVAGTQSLEWWLIKCR